MKRIILIAGLILAVGLGSYARKFVAEGKTHSALGNYKIQIDDKSMFIKGKEHVPFVITYENSNLEIRVAIDLDIDGKKYYVISDNLGVQYESKRHFFGVERLDSELEKDGLKTSDKSLDQLEFSRQKTIAKGRSWRRDNTKLIATYFPLLLNKNSDIFAAK